MVHLLIKLFGILLVFKLSTSFEHKVTGFYNTDRIAAVLLDNTALTPLSHCQDGYVNATGECQVECTKGTFGLYCERHCVEIDACFSSCAKPNGSCDCPSQCVDCSSPENCTKCVDPTKYGSQCELSCSPGCRFSSCSTASGVCQDGCQSGYWGTYCDKSCPVSCDRSCEQDSGRCVPCHHCLDKCDADSGACHGECEKGFYGPYCDKVCKNCYDTCDKDTGRCHCRSECLECNSEGKCSVCVDATKYGDDCEKKCPWNCLNGECGIGSGVCINGCRPGFWGEFCNTTCSPDCKDECNRYTGECMTCNNCLFGCSYSSGECSGSCKKGTFGKYCKQYCTDSEVCYGGCNKTTGACDCPSECRECGSFDDCYSCVDSTKYGNRCQHSCPANCKNGECSVRGGSCLTGCNSGYWGALCDQKCPTECENECDRTSGACLLCNNCLEGCSSDSGKCLGICEKGSFGQYCEKMCLEESECYSGCDKNTGSCNCLPDCLHCTSHEQCSVCLDQTKYGPKCDIPCPSHCRDGLCTIDSGRCLAGCEAGYWGEFCNYTCAEQCDGECQQFSGECLHCGKCLEGCSSATGECIGNCEKGTFGKYCEQFCTDLEVCYSGCNKTTGACDCPSECWECGSYGDCYSCVDPTKYGNMCQHSCPAKNGESSVRGGSCLTGCILGYWGTLCDKTCPIECENECDRTSGACLCKNCLEGCSFDSGECLGTCKNGTFGIYCERYCLDYASCYSGCDKMTGRCNCPNDCFECDSYGHCTSCVDTYKYGNHCEKFSCPTQCKSGKCSNVDGMCEEGCEPGFFGTFCDQPCTKISKCIGTTKPQKEQSVEDEDLSTGTIVGIAVAVAVVCAVVVMGMFLFCKRRTKHKGFQLQLNPTYDSHNL